MGRLLDWLFVAPACPAAAASLGEWRDLARAELSAFALPVERATAAGFVSDRLGYAFARFERDAPLLEVASGAREARRARLAAARRLPAHGGP